MAFFLFSLCSSVVSYVPLECARKKIFFFVAFSLLDTMNEPSIDWLVIDAFFEDEVKHNSISEETISPEENELLEKLISVCIKLNDVIIFKGNHFVILTLEEYYKHKQSRPMFWVSHKAYFVFDMSPKPYGMINRSTTVLKSRGLLQTSFSLKPIKHCNSTLNIQKICLDGNTFERHLRYANHESVHLRVLPSICLSGYDSIIVVNAETMKLHSLFSGQKVICGSRYVFIVSDKESQSLGLELENAIERGTDYIDPSNTAKISHNLFYNLECPSDITVKVSQSIPRKPEGSCITLHPINKYDIYSSSIAMTMSLSIQEYIKRQKQYIFWQENDILAIRIAARSLASEIEIECARVTDLVEHDSEVIEGRYMFFRVENYGDYSSEVVLGSSDAIYREDIEKLATSQTDVQCKRAVLPSVEPCAQILHQPFYHTIRKEIFEIHNYYYEKFAQSSKKENVDCMSFAAQSLIIGNEKNLILRMVIASSLVCGRQPIHIPSNIVGLENVRSFSRIAQQDFSHLLIISVSHLSQANTTFLEELKDIVTESSINIPVVLYFDGTSCPLFLQNSFSSTIFVNHISEDERLSYIHFLLKDIPLSNFISMEDIKIHTNRMSTRDLETIFLGLSKDAVYTHGFFIDRLKNFAKRTGLKASSIQKVTWKDIGGLQKQKQMIMKRLALPIKFPHLFLGRKASGILFHGPPGCGKTLLAKAVANEFGISFISVKGPELLNMFVGQSEKNIRDTFEKARENSPCILFFDEIDSIAPKRTNQGDSGGVMGRVVAQLLIEMDGIAAQQSKKPVFVFAATNRVDLIDKNLLRPGRFDTSIFLGPPTTKEEIKSMITALTRKLQLHNEVDIDEIAESILCCKRVSGADLYGIVSNSVLLAYESTGSFTLEQSHLMHSIKQYCPPVDTAEHEKTV